MYCRYCGKEVIDTAFVCPSCGSLIGKLPPEYQKQVEEEWKKQQEVDTFFGTQQSQQSAQTQQPQPTPCAMQAQQPVSRKEKVFSTLAKVLSIIGIVFSGIALFCLLLAVTDMITYGDGVLFALGWIYGMVCGVIGCQLGIAGFVFGCLQKRSQGVKKLSTWAFVLGIVSCVLAFWFIFSPWFYM